MVALVGARRWQQRRHEDSRFLIGAILVSPYAYASIPLGELPEYLPIVSATNIPIGIYQTTGSAIFSQFKTLLEQFAATWQPCIYRAGPGYYEFVLSRPANGSHGATQ